MLTLQVVQIVKIKYCTCRNVIITHKVLLVNFNRPTKISVSKKVRVRRNFSSETKTLTEKDGTDFPPLSVGICLCLFRFENVQNMFGALRRNGRAPGGINPKLTETRRFERSLNRKESVETKTLLTAKTVRLIPIG